MEKIMKQTIVAIIIALSMTSHVHADELSEDQIEEIAEQYIEACLTQNYTAWKSLFLDTGDVSEADFTTSPHVAKIKKIRIKDIDGYNVRLQIQYNFGYRKDGWLQLLPAGKIKYGAILHQHPIPIAFELQSSFAAYLNHDTEAGHPDSKRELLEVGIPVFGLNRRMKPHNQLKALKQIKEWLIEKGENWDRSEPKLACPEGQFKALLKKYK